LKTTVITREDSTAIFPSTISIQKIPYDLPSFTSALRGQDAVICCTVATALDIEKIVIDAAVAAGVKWFVPSEFGHDTSDERILGMLPMLRGKAGVIEVLKRKEREGLSWTGVVTGLFFDWVRILIPDSFGLCG
jgi:hypothetical protein